MFGRRFRSSSRFAFAKPIYRPFRADAFLNRYLGLKPQAESYCPFGAETITRSTGPCCVVSSFSTLLTAFLFLGLFEPDLYLSR